MGNKPAASIWLKKAKDDLLWTEANIREKIYYGACFTAQQAVEKALKAYLLSHGRITVKIHDITALLEQCSEIDSSFSSLREAILPLADYYVQSRYPDVAEFIEFTKEKAVEALEAARELVGFVENKI